MTDAISAFFAAANAHDVDALAACCTADVIADEVAEPEPFVGADALKQSYRDVFEGYPDCVSEIIERQTEGTNIACQVRWRATNTGTFRGVPPTGRPVDLRIAYFFHLRDGKIERITEYYDLAAILVQQGQLEL